ncbi:MAG: hypothetical protein ACJAZ0_002367 [Halioglobus sp.]|jgi:hypothetical protein
MKLICEFDNAHEADIAALHYRERGILTHVSSRYSNGLRMITGATTVGFWVVLDQQYQDALVLKQDMEYQPVTALTEQEMTELEHLAKNTLEDSSSKILFALGYTVLVTALTGYIFYLSYGLLAD